MFSTRIVSPSIWKKHKTLYKRAKYVIRSTTQKFCKDSGKASSFCFVFVLYLKLLFVYNASHFI